MTQNDSSTGSPRISSAAAESLRSAEAWLFDLDNTLYPSSTDLFAQIDVRMYRFISDFLDVGEGEARRLQKEYFHTYGTTLRGLMNRHDIDPGPFLDYVHDIDLAPLSPSPALASALGRLGGRKIIFTNATAGHAGRVTARLGVDGAFEAVFDIVDADYVPKPAAGVYDKLVADFDLDASRTVMVEDIARNLVPAAALGMTTVWVQGKSKWGAEGAGDGHIDHTTDDLVAWLEAVLDGA